MNGLEDIIPYSCPENYSAKYIIDIMIWEKRYSPRSTQTPPYIGGGVYITMYNSYTLRTTLIYTC